MNKLTARQQQVLDCIEQALRRNGRPPSIHEIMECLGVASPNGVAKHLDTLEAKGYITRNAGARGIKLTSSPAQVHSSQSTDAPIGTAYVPLIGSIAAGSPILAQESVEDVLPVPQSMVGPEGETFLLRVKGESMIEEGIMPGDLVMITRCDSVANGELAAVMVEDEATVKRFYRRDGLIVLEPANSLYEPIVVDPSQQNVAIAGRVTGLLRSYKVRL